MIAFCILLGVFGQLSMKSGMSQIGKIKLQDIFSIKFLEMISNPYVLLGITFYALAILIWLVVISREELSFAYPLLSIGYLLTSILSWILFGESMTLIKFLGILLVVGGVYLLLLKI